jgi:hypothetical protein
MKGLEGNFGLLGVPRTIQLTSSKRPHTMFLLYLEAAMFFGFKPNWHSSLGRCRKRGNHSKISLDKRELSSVSHGPLFQQWSVWSIVPTSPQPKALGTT